MKKNILIIICLFLGTVGFAAEQDSINRSDKKGRKQGCWEKIEDSVVRYKGHFINDRPTGTFTYFDKKGRVSAVMEFSRDGYAAKATIYFPDTTNAIMAKGFYLDHEKDSLWQFFNEKGKLVKEEHYKNNMLQGLATLYGKNGEVVETQEWHRGMRNGKWWQKTKDGEQQTTYLLNLSQGSYEAWYPDKTLYVKGQYDQGLKDGKWFFYTKDGRLAKTEVYKYNRMDKREIAVYVSQNPAMIDIDTIAYIFQPDTLIPHLIIATKTGNIMRASQSMQGITDVIGLDFFFFANKQYFVRFDEVKSLQPLSLQESEIVLKTKSLKIICDENAMKALQSVMNSKKVGD